MAYGIMAIRFQNLVDNHHLTFKHGLSSKLLKYLRGSANDFMNMLKLHSKI